MAELKTPEATPEQPKEGVEKKTETTPVEKKALPAPEKKPEAPVAPEHDPHDINQSIWSISRDKVRGPMGKLFFAGALAAAPWVVGGAYLGDKLLSNIPGVSSLYQVPKNIATSLSSKAMDVAAATITAPAAIVDIEENLREGFTGKVQKEARGVLEGIKEKVVEGVGYGARAGYEVGKFGLNAGKKGLEWGAEAIKVPFKAIGETVKIVNGTLEQIPIVGKAMPLVTTGLLVWGGHSLLMSSLPGISLSLANGYSTATGYLFDMLKAGWQGIW